MGEAYHPALCQEILNYESQRTTGRENQASKPRTRSSG